MNFVESHEFYLQVTLIRERERLWALGLDPKSSTGVFDRDDFRDLTLFCDAHPAYHIVSWLWSHRVVNYLEPTGYKFFLAKGNKDPRLTYCMIGAHGFLIPSAAKMRRQAFFTMIPGGEGRDNAQLFANALDHMWTSPFFHLR